MQTSNKQSELTLPPIRSLILVGGQSSRMGKPKYMLPRPFLTLAINADITSASNANGDVLTNTSKVSISDHDQSIPLLVYMIYLHKSVQTKLNSDNQLPPLSEADQEGVQTEVEVEITLSVRDETQMNFIRKVLHDDPAQQVRTCLTNTKITYILDRHPNSGPASGLASAFTYDDKAHWLVTGCDYPLLQVEALNRLVAEHRRCRRGVTCFVNDKGWSEPLLAVWGDVGLRKVCDALDRKAKMENGNGGGGGIGPSRILREMEDEYMDFIIGDDEAGRKGKGDYTGGVMKVVPDREEWVRSVNTPEEWERALEQLQFME